MKKSKIWNPQSEIQNKKSQSEVWKSPKSGKIQNMKSESLQSEIQNLKNSLIWNTESENWNPESEIWNPSALKFKI